jgi:hypothetical protein
MATVLGLPVLKYQEFLKDARWIWFLVFLYPAFVRLLGFRCVAPINVRNVDGLPTGRPYGTRLHFVVSSTHRTSLWDVIPLPQFFFYPPGVLSRTLPILKLTAKRGSTLNLNRPGCITFLLHIRDFSTINFEVFIFLDKFNMQA